MRIEELKEKCWNLRIEVLHKCWSSKTEDYDLFCKYNCREPNCILARHTRIDKNGKHSGYGKYRCCKKIAEKKPENFASSEIDAMRQYFGFVDFIRVRNDNGGWNMEYTGGSVWKNRGIF